MIALYRHIRKKKQSPNEPATPAKPAKPAKTPCVHQVSQQSQLQLQKQQDRAAAGATATPGVDQKYGKLSSSGAATAAPPPQVAAHLDQEVAPNQPAGPEEKCSLCQEEKRAARKYRWKIVLGLLFPFALQSLDVTIIASAVPWIAQDFREVSQLNWIISAFNLTSAAFIPFWGQMADIFGRHATIQACVVIMMIGSALCTAAPNNSFPVLLLGRGIQGLGCAGIGIIVRIIIADKVSLKENAKNWSIFSFTAGISYGLGPVVGGYLTAANWRWCFGINLPICLIAVPIIFFVLRKELLGPQPIPGLDADATGGAAAAAADNELRPIGGGSSQRTSGAAGGGERVGRLAAFSTRLTTLDAGGQLLFLFGFGLIILALTWGGATYGWNSAAVLSPLCVGIALVGAFVFWEWLMAPGNALARRWPQQKSMMPWKLIVSRNIGLLSYINFATGAAMYAVLYFCNLYFTIVKLHTAQQAGVQLLFYTPGLGAGVYLSMVLCNSYPRTTFAPIMLGSVVEAVGVGVLAWALYTEHTPTIFGMMAMTGAGTGLRLLPGPLHAIGFFPKHIASVVSLMAVSLPFGGTLALTIMTTVFNNLGGMGTDTKYHDFNVIQSLPPEVQAVIIYKAKMGIVWAFVAITPFMVLCMLAATLLGNVNITKEQIGGGGDEDGYGKHVIDGVYLLHLLRRWRGWRRHHGGAGAGDHQDLEGAENPKTLSATGSGADNGLATVSSSSKAA